MLASGKRGDSSDCKIEDGADTVQPAAQSMADTGDDVVNYDDFNSYLENILADCEPDAPPVVACCSTTTGEAGEGEERDADKIDSRGVVVSKQGCDPTEPGSVVSGGVTGRGADETAAVVVPPAAVAKEDATGRCCMCTTVVVTMLASRKLHKSRDK